jgi:hypothetical protein
MYLPAVQCSKSPQYNTVMVHTHFHMSVFKGKSKAIPVTGREGP